MVTGQGITRRAAGEQIRLQGKILSFIPRQRANTALFREITRNIGRNREGIGDIGSQGDAVVAAQRIAPGVIPRITEYLEAGIQRPAGGGVGHRAFDSVESHCIQGKILDNGGFTGDEHVGYCLPCVSIGRGGYRIRTAWQGQGVNTAGIRIRRIGAGADGFDLRPLDGRQAARFHHRALQHAAGRLAVKPHIRVRMGILQIAGIRPLDINITIPLHLLVVISEIAARYHRVEVRHQGGHIRGTIADAHVSLPGVAAIKGLGLEIVEQAVIGGIQAPVIPGSHQDIPRADADSGEPLVGGSTVVAQAHFRPPGSALVA